MKKKFLALFVLVLISLPLISQNNVHKALKDAGNSRDYPSSPYLVVFDKTFSKVMDSGLTYTTRQVLYKVLTVEGLKRLKALTFYYDPQSAFVEIKKAEIIKKSGKKISVSLERVKDYPAPARAIYWGAREKVVPFEKLEVGDGVYVETYKKGFTYALLFQDDEKYVPPMKGHFYDIVHFYSSIPIKTKIYKVSVPSNKKLQYEFYNGSARHYVHIVGSRMEYFWEVKNIKPYKREPSMVSPSDVFPKLLLSTSPDWKAKSLWFYKVNEDYGSFEYNKEIKDKVNKIIKGAKSDIEKISRLTHWVAEEIRYSGLSMGKGEGYTLHKGTMTFRDRCGVCKDKAGMLITMLRAAGFKAYPAMTMAGSRIDRIPADQFNHCVTVVKYNDKYMLLDPTWVPGVRELWSSAEQQQEYLMGIPEGADLKTTPISPPENHYLKYFIKRKILKNGKAIVKLVIEGEGQSDSMLRRFFTRSQVSEWDKNLKSEIMRLFPSSKILSIKYQNPYDISKPMKIEVKFEKDEDFLKGKNLIYLKSYYSKLPLGYAVGFSRFSEKLKKRKYPFRTRCSQLVKIKETIGLPFNFKLTNFPKLKKVKGSGADFNGKIFKKGKKIFINSTITLKKRIYQPEDWESFRDSLCEFRKIENSFFIVRGGKK